jgi:hypothetical protein
MHAADGVRCRTDADRGRRHASFHGAIRAANRGDDMSKGQHGNQEAKKPKKAATRPLSPDALAPANAPVVAERQKKR